MVSHAGKRVRALIVNDSGDKALLIERQKVDELPYWVLPGGHVEASDRTPVFALRRELDEELGASVTIRGLLSLIRGSEGDEFIFLASLDAWIPDRMASPENDRSDRGGYMPQWVPLRPEVLAGLELKPGTLKNELLFFSSNFMNVDEWPLVVRVDL